MTSKSKTQKDEPIDLEQNFILRMPPGQAMALTHELDFGNSLKDNLFIDLSAENRWGKVRYGGEVINAKMVDLPCIIETLKTTDNKTFYKTSDICQMLMCSHELEPSDEDSESPKKKKEKEKKHQHLHGIVPPLKNVRRRRFRKTLRKKPIDLASIEKEVKRLLRTDLEAVEVKYEEIADDDAPSGGDGGGLTESGASQPGTSRDIHLDEEKLFGEISSSDEEGDADINIDDDSDQDTEQMYTNPLPPFQGAADYTETSNADDEGDNDEIIERISSIRQQLNLLDNRINQQEMGIKDMANPDLRRKFEAVLDELYTERSDLLKDLERLQSS